MSEATCAKCGDTGRVVGPCADGDEAPRCATLHWHPCECQLKGVPACHEALKLLTMTHEMRAQLAPFLSRLEQRLAITATGADDAEMAFYELWLRQTRETLDELVKHLGRLKDPSRRRLFYALRTSMPPRDAIEKFGHSFRPDADLIPSTPKEDDPKFAELIQWLRENVSHEAGTPHPIVEESLRFEPFVEFCNGQAEHGDAMPPHVVLSPKVTVRITAKRSQRA